MQVLQLNSNNYNPQFGNIVSGKGGKKMLKQIAGEGNSCELLKVFKEANQNFAADIFVGENGIAVLDKLTGKKYFPTGKLLQKKASNIAVFNEVELFEGSSKQDIPLKDAKGVLEYLYLGESKVREGGIFPKFSTVKNYFTPQKESSYIIRQNRKSFAGDELHETTNKFTVNEDSQINQLVSQFNAAIQIAYDIKFQAEQAIEHKSNDAAKALDAFIDHLFK